LEYCYITGRNVKRYSHWKTIWWFLIKFIIQLPYKLQIILTGINHMYMKTYVHTKACTQMFTVVFFIIAGNRNNPDSFQWVNGYINCETCNTLISKKSWSMNTHNNLDESLRNYAEWKNTQSKSIISFMNHIWNDNFYKWRKIKGCQGLGHG
jgi:hypothetical protein